MTVSHSYIWIRSSWALPLLLAAGSFGSVTSRADAISGEAHPLAGDGAAWRWRVAECAPTLESQWWSPAGDEVASESVHFGAQGQITYTYDRMNVHEHAQVNIEGGRAMLTLTQGGTTRRRELISTLPILAGPMLVTFARDRLASLRAGKSFSVAYVVPDHLTTVDLRLQLDTADTERTIVQVAPTSALVRLVVSDATIEFDRSGRFTGFSGRVLPIRISNDRHEDLSARLVASRRAEVCPAQRIAAIER